MVNRCNDWLKLKTGAGFQFPKKSFKDVAQKTTLFCKADFGIKT
jgi:hypothetical protein